MNSKGKYLPILLFSCVALGIVIGGMINFHWDEQQIKIISDHAQDTCIFLSVHPDWNNSGDKLNELLFDVYGNNRNVTLLFDIGTNRQAIVKCQTSQLVETIR